VKVLPQSAIIPEMRPLKGQQSPPADKQIGSSERVKIAAENVRS